jgi:hypothetical protein
MKSILHPWQILLLVLAGWINRQQQNTIEYLITENQILREKLGKKRILLNERLILFGEESLRNATTQFLAHYHAERPHQGLKNRLIQPGAETNRCHGEIECRSRLGGMLRYYHREAA